MPLCSHAVLHYLCYWVHLCCVAIPVACCGILCGAASDLLGESTHIDIARGGVASRQLEGTHKWTMLASRQVTHHLHAHVKIHSTSSGERHNLP